MNGHPPPVNGSLPYHLVNGSHMYNNHPGRLEGHIPGSNHSGRLESPGRPESNHPGRLESHTPGRLDTPGRPDRHNISPGAVSLTGNRHQELN